MVYINLCIVDLHSRRRSAIEQKPAGYPVFAYVLIIQYECAYICISTVGLGVAVQIIRINVLQTQHRGQSC